MILGKKLGQTSFLDSKGNRVCATVLDYKGCTVVGNRTNDKDGYIANIIGFLKPKKLNKPQQQDFIKKNIDPKKHLKDAKVVAHTCNPDSDEESSGYTYYKCLDKHPCDYQISDTLRPSPIDAPITMGTLKTMQGYLADHNTQPITGNNADHTWCGGL